MPFKTKEAKVAWQIRWNKKNLGYKSQWNKKNREKCNVYQRQWNKENPEKMKQNREKSRLKQRYGISLEEYNLLFTKQEGKCAICGIHQSEIKRPLFIDHCHKAGKVRGLLCHKCNTALGFFNDDIENLRCAILYLNKKD